MNRLEFIADIQAGNVIPPPYVQSFLRHCEGKKASILLRWGLKKRTLKQNNYFKGIVVPAFGQYLRGEGCKVTDEQADLLIKRWCGFTRLEELPDGEVVAVTRSTTECDTKEMAELTEHAIAVIAQKFGFMIPFPQEAR